MKVIKHEILASLSLALLLAWLNDLVTATTTSTTTTTTTTAETTATATGSATTGSATATGSTETTTGTASASTASSSASTTASATSSVHSLHTTTLGNLANGLGLGQETLQGQQFVGSDEDLVVGLERGGDHAILQLNGEVEFVHGSQDLVHLADLALVLEVNWGIEVRDLDVGGFADHLTLASVHKLADLGDALWGAEGRGTAAKAAATTSSSTTESATASSWCSTSSETHIVYNVMGKW